MRPQRRCDAPLTTPPSRVRPAVPLALARQSNVHVISTLALGARMFEISPPEWLPPDTAEFQLESVPAQLAGLSELTKLSFGDCDLLGDFEHIPAQLRELNLYRCGLVELPAELERLVQLEALTLHENHIKRGWKCLPAQLRMLDLNLCGLQRVPALERLTQLSKLHLSNNSIQRGWKRLPPQLEALNLYNCRLPQVTAALARLTRLRELSLSSDPIESGWECLPPQLEELRVHSCGLQQIPAAMKNKAVVAPGALALLQPHRRRLEQPAQAAAAAGIV